MLFFLAVFPPLFLIYLIYKLDKHEKEPFNILFNVFILGCLTVIPVLFLEIIVQYVFNFGLVENILSVTGSGLLGDKNLHLLLYVVFGIAIIEEYFKYLVLTRYAYKRDSFNEPMDGIVYGVVASLGFALIENVMYVFKYEDGYYVAIARMFSAIPAHALMGVIMGYYVGKAKFSGNNERQLMLKGLLAATILHSLYDYFLFLGSGLGIFAFISLLISFFIAKKAIKESQDISPFI